MPTPYQGTSDLFLLPAGNLQKNFLMGFREDIAF